MQPPANLWVRMAAWLYEGLLLFALCALTGVVFSIATQSTHALKHHHLLSAVLFLTIGCYFVWFWTKGQTLAMKTWRIKITDRHGEPVSYRRAALRYLLAWLWFAPTLVIFTVIPLTSARLYPALGLWLIFYILLAWLHPSKQFVHDLLAGTRLVRTAAN